MTKRFSIVIFIFFITAINITSAFWSLETDLQLGYEIYDRSYEINAAIQAILAAAARNNIIQTDSNTRAGVAALTAIQTQLKSAPSNFFNELASAAASRSRTEEWHISRLRSYHASYINSLEILTNSTGALSKLDDVTNPLIMSTLRKSLTRIQEHSRNVLIHAETVTVKIGQVRANASLLLTPKLLDEFIGNNATELTTSLIQLRNSYLLLLLSVRDSARLTAAYGSMYDIMDKSTTKDKIARNASLFNFVNSYNRVRNTLLSSVVSYRQSAQTGFSNFIQKVQANYDDTIVRSRFDREQLPLILTFADVVTKRVYNQTFFEISFDGMKNAIVEAYETDTNDVFTKDSQYRDVILNLLRESYTRNYSSCLNDLVSEAQEGLNAITGKYSFCLDERTSSITVVIPSTSSWLSVIRDNVNFILQQLNNCLNSGSSVAGRTATSDCIQSNANNLQFYAMYLPLTVETNLRPIVQSPPIIFRNCINILKVVADDHVGQFNEVYEKCKSSNLNEIVTENPTTITETEATTTTFEITTSSKEENSTLDWTTIESEKDNSTFYYDYDFDQTTIITEEENQTYNDGQDYGYEII
ncbi:hypothetical protein PVAND_012432 [Polypedilum vanderplanki]|uniref:Uncharacterized protein n=1 Tax=Polypedilum vanderplanki TaxID=319348 RepID=A0A9J6CMH0_POLVA|nr:hypothetical protein PVAND_012432 [Polypedilum vanderplanki]